MKSFISYLYESYKRKSLKEDAVIAAGDAGAAADGLSNVAASADSDIVQNDSDDDEEGKSHGTSANDVLGKYEKGKGCFGPGDFHKPDMLFKYDRFGGASAYKKTKKRKKKSFDNSAIVKELNKLFESWNPDFDNKPKNEWGEEWQEITGHHWLLHVLNSICQECMLDPLEDHAIDSIRLYTLHYVLNGGHYIAHLCGGTNGLNDRKKLAKYMALIKKFATKLLDVHEIETAWLIDFTNDCADDVWDLRIGFRLREESEKLKQ